MIGNGIREQTVNIVEGAFDEVLQELSDFKSRLMQKDDFGRWEYDRVQLHDSLIDIMEKL